MTQQNLQYVFSRSRSPYSVAIRAFPPNGPYSHCGILLPEGVVIESLAIKNGVVFTELDKFIERNSRVSLMEVPAPNVYEANAWARNTIGDGYDWLYVFGIPFRIRGLNRPKAWACSEHCAQYAVESGLDIFAPGMHGLTPTHLYQLFYSAGGRVTKELKT